MSARRAILKHCVPNGIPTTVTQNSSPCSAQAAASSKPPKISHSRLSSSEGAPPAYRMTFPKGKKARRANLKHCTPIGIPTIVIHHSSPTKSQPSPIHNPPNKNQRIFPKNFILIAKTEDLIRNSLSPIPRNRQKVAYKGATFLHFCRFINKKFIFRHFRAEKRKKFPFIR